MPSRIIDANWLSNGEQTFQKNYAYKTARPKRAAAMPAAGVGHAPAPPVEDADAPPDAEPEPAAKPVCTPPLPPVVEAPAPAAVAEVETVVWPPPEPPASVEEDAPYL